MKTIFKTIAVAFAASAAMFLFSPPASAQQPQLGATDFASYLRQAPALPLTIEEAAKRAYGNDVLNGNSQPLDEFYRPFLEKLRKDAEAHQSFFAKKMESWQANQSQAAIQAQYAAQVNANPIVAGMGGMENIQNMSEEERKAAATQAAANYMADPFAANGVQSAGMTALYQKIIADPAYAARFEKMSDAEKEAELRKYMANDKPQAMTPAQMQEQQRQREAQATQADKVRNAMEVQQKLSDLHVAIAGAGMKFQQQVEAISNAAGSHDEIQQEHGKKYEKIPEVVYGEYGRDKDIEQVKPLELETARKHRQRAAAELKQVVAPLHELQVEFQRIVADYKTWFAQADRVNDAPEDFLNGLNTEITLASFEANLFGLADELAKYSKQLTAEAANWEKNYVNKMQSYR